MTGEFHGLTEPVPFSFDHDHHFSLNLVQEEGLMIEGGIRRNSSQDSAWFRRHEFIAEEHTAHRRYAHSQRRFYEIAKRLFDLVCALILVVLLSPILLALAIAIKLDSPGPVIFVSPRAGRYGKPFSFFKFRSMYAGVDHLAAHREFVKDYLNGNDQNGVHDGNGNHIYKPTVIRQGVTPVGRWLRRTSLDELPQLFNILKGDMSFVGPRPPMPYELAYYKDWHMRRLDVPPGLTSLAQINGRSSLPFDKGVAYDIEYIEQRSFWFDLVILWQTVPVVLLMRDAG